MNLNSMLNGSEGLSVKKRKNSAHILNLLNNQPSPAVSNAKPKPKKYAEPPIWAQSWKSGKENAVTNDITNGNAPTQSKAGLGPGGVSSLLGLPPSLSGVVPAEDLNRRICEWLYGHMHQLGDKRKDIEVEFKLGTACSKQNNKRIQLPVLSEVLLESQYVKEQVYFEPGIAHNYFGRIETLIDQYAASHVLEPLGETRTRDQFHPVDGGATVRVSLDERDQLVEKITKQRIGDLIIHFPREAIDLRISLSLEIPYEGGPSDVRAPNLVRNKNRSSWKTKGLRLDLTNVITDGKGSTKEVELEMDSAMLLQFFTDFENKTDSLSMDKFEELVRYGLDNCRLITRGVLKEA